jgi:16S rRNA (adenine1518-N6/adenine1519-N6)-dimethyltransferase
VGRLRESQSPKAQLLALGLTAKRHFGQNFLADPSLAGKIADLAAPPGATVIELGAGLGALTEPLLSRAAHVIAVERDRDLVPVLKRDFADEIAAGRLEVLEADAKAIAPAELLSRFPAPHVLCGNLPYQITGPLLELCVNSATALARAVFLVQLEVAARLAAPHDTPDYGALSVFTQAVFEVRRAFIVRRGAFYPQPGVDSAVVVLTPREGPTLETTQFQTLVHAAFGQRRKKLSNAWRGLFGFDTEQLASVAARAGINLDQRGETLSVEQFTRMAREVEALGV